MSHFCRADKNPYRHDGRADKDSYRHDGRAYSLSRKFYRDTDLTPAGGKCKQDTKHVTRILIAFIIILEKLSSGVNYAALFYDN